MAMPTMNLQRYCCTFFVVGPMVPTPMDPFVCVTRYLDFLSEHAPVDVLRMNPSCPDTRPTKNLSRPDIPPDFKIGREQSDAMEMKGPLVFFK